MLLPEWAIEFGKHTVTYCVDAHAAMYATPSQPSFVCMSARAFSLETARSCSILGRGQIVSTSRADLAGHHPGLIANHCPSAT